MIIGALLTMLVQSSSITTSVLTPLVGIGVIPLESMFPLTLGANLGTTMTALMASLVSDSVDSLQVALAHLFFNITGTIIWYPVPFMRRIPLRGAVELGRATRTWRGFPIIYIIVVFLLIPLFFLGLSALFTQHTKGWTVLGSMIVIMVILAMGWTAYWCQYKDGQTKMITYFKARQEKKEAIDTLPAELKALKRKLDLLMEHTGAVDDENDNEDDEEIGNTSDEGQKLVMKTDDEDDEIENEIQT